MITVLSFTTNDKVSGIYCILNKITAKTYIGSGVNVNKRYVHHKIGLTNKKHFNKLLQRAWNKYGADAFEFMVLEIVTDVALLLEREQYWIDLTQSSNPNFGYNLSPTAGSILGLKYSDEVRAKMSASMTVERRAKLSKAITGKILGPRPDEVKAKIKATLSGQKLSDERKAKISKTLTGVKLSEETKIKLKKVWADRKAKALNELLSNCRMI